MTTKLLTSIFFGALCGMLAMASTGWAQSPEATSTAEIDSTAPVDPATVAFREGRKAKLAKDMDGALAKFNEAVKLGYTRAHKEIAKLHLSRGNDAKAMRHFDAYITAHPGAPDAARIRAKVEKMKEAALR